MLSHAEQTAIRSRFPIFRDKIYLNSCSQGALSDSVEKAMADYLTSWRELGSPWELWVEEYERARSCFAAMIGAEPDEVAVVPSASAGINAVAHALDFGERRKVVMGDFEFPTMGQIWLAQAPRGAEVRFVAARGKHIPLAGYKREIDRQTLIVPVTQVCYMNGARSEVEGITEAAHREGALVLLDGYQDYGTRPINVKRLGVDFFVSGTLKYLVGPPGVAFLYVRGDLIPRLRTTLTGWFGQRDPFAFEVHQFDPAPNARMLEMGTPPVPLVYQAMAGMKLLQSIGLERIADHVAGLARELMAGAAELGLQIKTPADSVGPLVVVQTDRLQEALAKLSERNIVASGRHDGVRLSLHVYNNAADVRAALDVLASLRSLMVAR